MAARDYYDTAHSSVGCPTMVCFCFAWAWESVVFAYRIFKEPQLLRVWAQKMRIGRNFHRNSVEMNSLRKCHSDPKLEKS